MESTADLQIHSNVSVPIIPDFEGEVETVEDPFIRHGKYRAFIRKAALGFFVLTLFMMQALLTERFAPDYFHSYFRNYASIKNPYAIAAMLLLVAALAALAAVPRLARGLPSFFMAPLVYGLAFYLINLGVRVADKMKSDRFLKQDFYYLYGAFLFGGAGLLINTLAIGKKLNPRLGVALSGAAQLVLVVVLNMTKTHSDLLWAQALWVAGATLLAVYLNYDARLMINQRDDFYLQSDWFLAFAHFLTDFTFRFWRDLCKPQKKKAVVAVKSRADRPAPVIVAKRPTTLAESRVVRSAQNSRAEKAGSGDLEAPEYLSAVRKPSVETSASQQL